MFIGQDHTTNLISHTDLQMCSHRIDHKIAWNLSDNDLRHWLLFGVHNDDYYTRPDVNLDNILKLCKVNNIVPMINNNACYLDRNIPVTEYARRCKLIAEILQARGFNMAYISILNEPGKPEICGDKERYKSLVNTSYGAVAKKYPIVAGNDEFGMIDWNWLARECLFDVIGVHPLSCLGYPPDLKTILDWATIATAYGKRIVANEAGSWYVSQMNKEGWYVVRDIILECKKYNYEACCIVSIDTNDLDHPLGFRRWDKYYTTLIAQNQYWNDFISLVNKEGKKYKQGGKDMEVNLNGYKKGSKGVWVKFIQEVCNESGPLTDPDTGNFMLLLKVDGDFGDKTEKALKAFQSENELKPDGWAGDKTLEFMIKEYGTQFRILQYRWMRGER